MSRCRWPVPKGPPGATYVSPSPLLKALVLLLPLIQLHNFYYTDYRYYTTATNHYTGQSQTTTTQLLPQPRPPSHY
eukprot:2248910-Pyramimonas_sp.AAC.1